jgi:hypothetical protein
MAGIVAFAVIVARDAGDDAREVRALRGDRGG